MLKMSTVVWTWGHGW